MLGQCADFAGLSEPALIVAAFMGYLHPTCADAWLLDGVRALSQLLTLHTTPVVYLYVDRVQAWLSGSKHDHERERISRWRPGIDHAWAVERDAAEGMNHPLI